MREYRDAIASIESAGSGDYSAVGPVTGSGDRAYGRYQVMGANIPEWSRKVLGRSVTPQEFISSPEIQDAVFDGIFGEYVNKYGPEGAASMWFSGDPSPDGSRDILGTSDSGYVEKFRNALNGPGGYPNGNALTANGFNPNASPYGNALTEEPKPPEIPQVAFNPTPAYDPRYALRFS